MSWQNIKQSNTPDSNEKLVRDCNKRHRYRIGQGIAWAWWNPGKDAFRYRGCVSFILYADANACACWKESFRPLSGRRAEHLTGKSNQGWIKRYIGGKGIKFYLAESWIDTTGMITDGADKCQVCFVRCRRPGRFGAVLGAFQLTGSDDNSENPRRPGWSYHGHIC